VWERFARELAGTGLRVVAVALDVRPADAHPFIDASEPEAVLHLIDTTHATVRALGFVNVPMAVWFDERGRLARPAEFAAIERSPLRDAPVPDGLPDRMRRMLTEVRAITAGDPDAYRAAIADFAAHGAASPYALDAEAVAARSGVRSPDQARAAACFELGQYRFVTDGHAAAVPWWREAHRLDPVNWAAKRQAWTMVTTPDGAEANDLVQGPNDVYDGNWLDDVVAAGGGGAYYPPLHLES
jgi:hypothetical protein